MSLRRLLTTGTLLTALLSGCATNYKVPPTKNTVVYSTIPTKKTITSSHVLPKPGSISENGLFKVLQSSMGVKVDRNIDPDLIDVRVDEDGKGFTIKNTGVVDQNASWEFVKKVQIKNYRFEPKYKPIDKTPKRDSNRIEVLSSTSVDEECYIDIYEGENDFLERFLEKPSKIIFNGVDLRLSTEDYLIDGVKLFSYQGNGIESCRECKELGEGDFDIFSLSSQNGWFSWSGESGGYVGNRNADNIRAFLRVDYHKTEDAIERERLAEEERIEIERLAEIENQKKIEADKKIALEESKKVAEREEREWMEQLAERNKQKALEARIDSLENVVDRRINDNIVTYTVKIVDSEEDIGIPGVEVLMMSPVESSRSKLSKYMTRKDMKLVEDYIDDYVCCGDTLGNGRRLTDKDGEISFRLFKEGKYPIEIRRKGYLAREGNVKVEEGNKKIPMSVRSSEVKLKFWENKSGKIK